jgi:ABC-type dipeptide/oligopeptide/nickel transport system permease component
VTEAEAKVIATTLATALGIPLGSYCVARIIPFTSKLAAVLPEINSAVPIWWVMYEHKSAVQLRLDASDPKDLIPVRVDVLVSPSSGRAIVGEEL